MLSIATADNTYKYVGHRQPGQVLVDYQEKILNCEDPTGWLSILRGRPYIFRLRSRSVVLNIRAGRPLSVTDILVISSITGTAV